MLVWKGERFTLRRMRTEPTLPMAIVFQEEGVGEQYHSDSWDLADAAYVILCSAEEKEELDAALDRVDDTKPAIPDDVRTMKEVYDYFYRELRPNAVFFNEADAHKRATELLKLWMTTKEEGKKDAQTELRLGLLGEGPGTPEAGRRAPAVQGGTGCPSGPGPGSSTTGLPLP